MKTQKEKLKELFKNVYFINGTAYAGKSTMVRTLAEKYDGIACGENYHDALLDTLDRAEFPGLCYTRDLQDWRLFIRRTPQEYSDWIDSTAKECEILELRILEELASTTNKPIFVDTNICVETLKEISGENNVVIMLADHDISVKRFFDRPDREKQFLYKLLMEEENPQRAMENYRRGLSLINSQEKYDAFLNSGFPVVLRDESRTVEQTASLVAEIFKLK
ncbi:MAG: hypothetical protein IKU54_00430 [Oscillospiraceae bacterium]|nr:hypothetical protein [Oscillospiraceae bacterium]